MSAQHWQVQIINPANGKPKVWGSYPDRDRAQSVAATRRHHRFFAQIRRIDEAPDDPFTSRQRFLTAALMAGLVVTQRMVERVIQEIEREART